MLASPRQGSTVAVGGDAPGGRGGDHTSTGLSPMRTGYASGGCDGGASRPHGKNPRRGPSEERRSSSEPD